MDEIRTNADSISHHPGWFDVAKTAFEGAFKIGIDIGESGTSDFADTPDVNTLFASWLKEPAND